MKGERLAPAVADAVVVRVAPAARGEQAARADGVIGELAQLRVPDPPQLRHRTRRDLGEIAEHALRFVGIILFVLVYVIGLAGNATLAFTILANKWMRTKSNVFVVSLAIGDFLLILITVPMAMQRYITDSWNFGDILCKVI